MKKTLIVRDPHARAVEEFAEYWPMALKQAAEPLLRATHGQIRMQDMIDVFRSVFDRAFMQASVTTLEEMKRLDEMKRQGIDVLAFIHGTEELP